MISTYLLNDYVQDVSQRTTFFLAHMVIVEFGHSWLEKGQIFHDIHQATNLRQPLKKPEHTKWTQRQNMNSHLPFRYWLSHH